MRTEDIQSLDEDSSSLRDYSDIDPDCETMTRSCPLPEQTERLRNGEAARQPVVDSTHESKRTEGEEQRRPGSSSAPVLHRSHTIGSTSPSVGSGGGMVRMTSFAEQKFRKLEGRSSGGTTPECPDLPYAQQENASPQVCDVICVMDTV